MVVRRLLGNEPVGGLEGAAEIAYGGPVLPGQRLDFRLGCRRLTGGRNQGVLSEEKQN